MIEKIFKLSVVIEAFKKSLMFLCTPFTNRCLVYSDWALYHLAELVNQTVSVLERGPYREVRLYGQFPV